VHPILFSWRRPLTTTLPNVQGVPAGSWLKRPRVQHQLAVKADSFAETRSTGLAIGAVCCTMTVAAKNDQVFLRICAASATMLQMVQFEVIPPATTLASPAVTVEYALAQFLVVAG
jgi:hypothetical protein